MIARSDRSAAKPVPCEIRLLVKNGEGAVFALVPDRTALAEHRTNGAGVTSSDILKLEPIKREAVSEFIWPRQPSATAAAHDHLGGGVQRVDANFGAPGDIVALRGATMIRLQDGTGVLARDMVEISFHVERFLPDAQPRSFPPLRKKDFGQVVLSADGSFVIGILVAGRGYSGLIAPVHHMLADRDLALLDGQVFDTREPRKRIMEDLQVHNNAFLDRLSRVVPLDLGEHPLEQLA